MAAIKYNIVNLGDASNLTMFYGGEMYVASETHPNWDAIVKGVVGDDTSVVDLFDVSATVAKRFERLTDRATVANGRLYFDGDEMHNALSDEVVRFLNAGVEADWKPLVNFLEKVQQNPQEDSRNQLYEFLSRHEFTITPEGDIVGYKSVRSDGNGAFLSISSGTATVNGEVKTGRIPQKVGDVVEMPRSEVAFDPEQACSAGLHVANWKYASTWTTHDAVLAIGVNPRDVVSVPSGEDFAKVRVCRYTVLSVVDHKSEALVYDTVADDVDDYVDDDDLYCDYCGEYGHEEEDCDERIDDEDTAASKETYAAKHTVPVINTSSATTWATPPTLWWGNV